MADFLDLNAANEKEIVADYGLAVTAPYSIKPVSGPIALSVRGWPEYEQWLQACYERASAYNLQFAVPLDENEVSGIAKSIAKWTSSKFSEESFSDFVKKTHTKKFNQREVFYQENQDE